MFLIQQPWILIISSTSSHCTSTNETVLHYTHEIVCSVTNMIHVQKLEYPFQVIIRVKFSQALRAVELIRSCRSEYWVNSLLHSLNAFPFFYMDLREQAWTGEKQTWKKKNLFLTRIIFQTHPLKIHQSNGKWSGGWERERELLILKGCDTGKDAICVSQL